MDIEPINDVREEEALQQIIPISEESLVFSIAAFRKMVGMSVPLMLSHLTNMLGGFGNVYLFSRLSAESLASAGLITATQNLFVASFGSSLFGASVLMTETLNQENQEPKTIGILWRQVQLITFAYDLVVIPIFFIMGPILSHLGQNETLLPHIQNYFNYYGIGYAFNLLSLGNQQILLSQQNTLPILLINTITNLSNFGLGYLLIIKKNNWGERAVSSAYGISSSMSLLLGSIYISLKYQQNKLFSFKLEDCLANVRGLLKKGLPMGLQNGAEVIALWISMLMAGKFGNANLTAAEIAGQYVYILTVPGFALGQVTSILSAEQYAHGNYSELRSVGLRAMLLSQLLPLCGMVLFVTIPRQLSQFFLTHNEDADQILQTTSRLLIINGIGQLFDGLRQTLTGALIGQNDNFFPMMTNITSMCVVGILSSYLISFLGDQGIDGIFVGRSSCIVLAALVLAIRWFKIIQGVTAPSLLQNELTNSREQLLENTDELADSQQSMCERNTISVSNLPIFFSSTISLTRSHSFSESQVESMEKVSFSSCSSE